MEPLVSIITPAYNCERTIGETIESVRKQNYNNWEHIIIDDFSKDNTRLLIGNYAKEDNRIKPIYLKVNSGVANARNVGIQKAIGKYIAFLDSDDLWKEDKLHKQIKYMEENNCDFTYSNYEVIDSKGIHIKNIVQKKNFIDYNTLLSTNQIGCLTVVIKSDIMKKVLMPLMKHEDYAAWLTILKDYVKYAERVDGILASYRRMKGSVSSNKIKTIFWTWNIYKNNQKLSYFEAFKRLIILEIHAFIKRWSY